PAAQSSESVHLDRLVNKHLIFLGLRFVLIFGFYVSDGAFSFYASRQDHHAYEMRGSILPGLRKHRIDAGLEPGLTRLNPEVMALRLDANASALQAAYAGAFMGMRERHPAGWKIDPVAPHQVIDARLQARLGLQRQLRLHAGAGSRFGILTR